MMMRNTPAIAMSLLAATFVAVGCKESTKKDGNAATTESAQIDRIKQDTKDLSQDIKDYAYTQKDEFVVKMKADLDALNREVDQLGTTIEKAEGDAKDEARLKLDALRAQTTELSKQLDEAVQASESTWDQARDRLKQSYDASADGVRQARQWVSEKIAP